MEEMEAFGARQSGAGRQQGSRITVHYDEAVADAPEVVRTGIDNPGRGASP